MTILRLAVDADALAATLRETSEREIRAHARRIVADRGDALRVMSAEQCRSELLALGELVANEEPHADALAAASLPYLTAVSNATACFEDLVEAISDRRRFVADPDEWLVRHDLPLSTMVYETHDEATEAQVDQCVDALMTATPQTTGRPQPVPAPPAPVTPVAGAAEPTLPGGAS